jgi:glycosyltransferase involved in cell wall biosynthesis
MNPRPLKVAWISYFPVEWLPDAPPEIRALPKRHPASWQQSCVEEMKRNPLIELHVVEVSKRLSRSLTFRSGNVTFHCVKVPGGLRAPSLFWMDTLVIGRKLREVGPDVVHAWGTEHGAALVASRLAYPYVISLQGLLGYFSKLLPLRPYERLASIFEKASLKRAQVATGESTFVVNFLKRNYPNLRVFRVEHTPTQSFFNLQRRPASGPIQFLSVGIVGYRKGTDLLLNGLNRVLKEIDFQLTMISFHEEPGYLDALRTQTSPALWGRIRLLKNITEGELQDCLSRATIALFPTRADTGPVAVKEAVIAGVPVVGSEMGGIPDYVVPGRNGLIFPPGSVDRFVSSVREACQHPLFKRGVVEAETHSRVRRELSPAMMADRFSRLYFDLAQIK